MARQLKELRNLMPWTWDARVEDHPPGEAAMRDFQDAFSWTGRPSRNAHQPEAATASPRHKPASAALAQAKKRPCKENTSSRPAKRSIRRRDCGEADPPATNSKPLHRVSFKTPSDAGADEPSATSSPACRQSSVLDAKMEVAGTDCVTVPGTVKKDPVSSHRLEASTLAEATPIAVHVDGAMTPGSAISAQTPAVGLQSRSSMGLDTGDNTAPASAVRTLGLTQPSFWTPAPAAASELSSDLPGSCDPFSEAGEQNKPAAAPAAESGSPEAAATPFAFSVRSMPSSSTPSVKSTALRSAGASHPGRAHVTQLAACFSMDSDTSAGSDAADKVDGAVAAACDAASAGRSADKAATVAQAVTSVHVGSPADDAAEVAQAVVCLETVIAVPPEADPPEAVHSSATLKPASALAAAGASAQTSSALVLALSVVAPEASMTKPATAVEVSLPEAASGIANAAAAMHSMLPAAKPPGAAVDKPSVPDSTGAKTNGGAAFQSLELWPAAPLDVESSFVSEGPPLDEEMSTVFGERSFTDDEQPAKDPSGLLGNHLQQRPAKELPLFSPGGPKELLPAVKSPAMLGSEVLTPAMPLDLRPALPASAMVTRSNRQSRGRGPPATFRVPDTRRPTTCPPLFCMPRAHRVSTACPTAAAGTHSGVLRAGSHRQPAAGNSDGATADWQLQLPGLDWGPTVSDGAAAAAAAGSRAGEVGEEERTRHAVIQAHHVLQQTGANAVLRGCARLRISDARAGWLY